MGNVSLEQLCQRLNVELTDSEKVEELEEQLAELEDLESERENLESDLDDFKEQASTDKRFLEMIISGELSSVEEIKAEAEKLMRWRYE